MRYGDEPLVVESDFVLPDYEMVFCLYMPVRLPFGSVRIPKHLEPYTALIDLAVLDHKPSPDEYIYLTAKRLFVERGCMGGRRGWHTDGFGTSDVNYIWTDREPTEFCIQPFDLSNDHDESMREMEMQARPENIKKYRPLDVLRIDARHVHRCPEDTVPGVRTFARVSFSKERYNLSGNAQNHELDYSWIMHPRGVERNNTAAA